MHGWGVFALESISKNKRIIDYAGQKITAKQSTPREVRYLKQGHIWCFTLNRNWAIDAAVDGNAARFINHSCRGNCYVQIIKGVIWIRASRQIRKGEELSYNYNTDGAAEIPCRCRPGCQGMLSPALPLHGGPRRFRAPLPFANQARHAIVLFSTASSSSRRGQGDLSAERLAATSSRCTRPTSTSPAFDTLTRPG